MLLFLPIELVVCARPRNQSGKAAPDNSFLGWNPVRWLSDWTTRNYGSQNHRPAKYGAGLASAPDDQRRVCSVRRNYFGEKGYPGTPGNPCGASLSGVRQYNSPWLHDQSTSRVNRLLCRRGGPTPQYQSKVRSFITRYGPLGPGWKPSTIPSWPEHESNPVSNDDIAIPAREIVQRRRSRRRHKLRGRSQKRRSHRRESTEYG